jgi:hypothetical protein
VTKTEKAVKATREIPVEDARLVEKGLRRKRRPCEQATT